MASDPPLPDPPPPKPLSPRLQAMADAIRTQPKPVRAVFCGIGLYLELLGSGHCWPCEFLLDGRMADGHEAEDAVKVPFLAIGNRIVVGFDPTLPPDRYYFRA